MCNSTDHPTINHISVRGKGHIQPGVNQWIGVFTVADDLLDGDPSSWIAATVDYEGPFYCRSIFTHGRGEGQIIHVRRGSTKDEIIINIEGTCEPNLEGKENMPGPGRVHELT